MKYLMNIGQIPVLCKDEQCVELRGNVPHEATANKAITKIVDDVQP